MAAACCCGLECVLCATCARWAWRRCSHSGAHDSASWPTATTAEFSPIPRACRAILAAYEDDLSRPRWAPNPGGYRMDPTAVIRRASYADTADRCPPYLIYHDRANAEIVLAVRGLNLGRGADYRLLLDNQPEAQPFDGGYVHRGLLKAAVWLLNREAETLRQLIRKPGRIAGFEGINRERLKCYAIAPARCMSLDLAVKYATVIHSVVLQDDFLPRTPTPLENIFGSIFCLPCLISLVCMRDTFISENKMLKDPKRLYAPGRMYHIVERRSCSCGRMPPEVRTAIPVEGRFEHIVLSCNAIYDHSLVWIEHEAQVALEILQQEDEAMVPPIQPRIERDEYPQREQKDEAKKEALLNTHHALIGKESSAEKNVPFENEHEEGSCTDSRSDWEELVEKLFISDDEDQDMEFEAVSSVRDDSKLSLIHR
ncbi:hypothetical protein HPP92_022469 [Vanilla planifolia]|uniref:Mono-/di-acylglycerol lipase N-terminal domain-containing protein n=1 Tax=Vanilla planifolia TaxID=51239 RepID=A0A835UH93_VANPL|nr:hypothetical protein HPP92_022469 [Vanilla planifolia]